MSTVPQGFSFNRMVYEARQIIRAHSHHFFTLSLLFLFPFCFSIIIYPTLYAALSHLNGFRPRQWLLFFTADPTDLRARPILLLLLFNLFALCLTPCALGTITYSTLNGFYGRPVTLASSIKSLLHSFLPLLSTLIVSQIIFGLIGMVFGVLAALVLNGLQIFGLEVSYDSIYSRVLVIFFVLLLVAVMLWLQVNWSLAYVIVVVESKWGYEPLRRSAQLVKGMRRVASSILLLYGLMFSSLVVINSLWLGTVTVRLIWVMVFPVVYTSSLATELMLQSFAANVVLYIYCKPLHGEVALFEIAEKLASENVSLPLDNGKVSEVVYDV